jgi:hypothetical protein
MMIALPPMITTIAVHFLNARGLSEELWRAEMRELLSPRDRIEIEPSPPPPGPREQLRKSKASLAKRTCVGHGWMPADPDANAITVASLRRVIAGMPRSNFVNGVSWARRKLWPA